MRVEGDFAECGVEPVPEGLPRSGKGVMEHSADLARAGSELFC